MSVSIVDKTYKAVSAVLEKEAILEAGQAERAPESATENAAPATELLDVAEK